MADAGESHTPTAAEGVTRLAAHSPTGRMATLDTSVGDPGNASTTTTRGDYMHCPVCRLRVDGRSQLIAHLRSVRDPDHKDALAVFSPIFQELRGLHVLACPLWMRGGIRRREDRDFQTL